MGTSEIIQPSYILPCKVPVLGYSPSLRCCLVGVDHDVLGFLNIDSRTIVKQIPTHDLSFVTPTTAVLSSDSSLLAVDADTEKSKDQSNRIPAQIDVFNLAYNSSGPSCSISLSPFYRKSPFGFDQITNIKFLPDGSRILATVAGVIPNGVWPGPWCKIFTLPRKLWDESYASDCGTANEDRNNEVSVCNEISVCQQGFPIPHDQVEINRTEEMKKEYDSQCYLSKLDGFYGLAISPDTLRILAGDNDSEVYIIETANGKVLQCVRAYWYLYFVLGCHYSPVVGHHEFATCSENGILDIWSVKELDDGTEEAFKVHHLNFEEWTSCCTYSPDGKLIALTSAAVLKTYIISSHSGETLYTLVHKEPLPNQRGFAHRYAKTSSLFIGYSCQVATMHFDSSICFWKLPYVYSLKTLCSLVIRSAVKYNDIDNLPVPTELKLLLTYLYV